MPAALHYDVDAASRTAAAWTEWADRINRAGHDLRWDLRRWALDEVVTAAPAALDEACTELWTAAELTRLLTAAVVGADRAPFSVVAHIGALLARSRVTVMLQRPTHAHDGRWHARTRWLADVPASEARAWFDRRHPEGVVEALSELDDERVLLYWELLAPDERREACAARPDLVALRIIANGRPLDPAELDLLDAANAYPVFSQRWAAELELSVGLRIVEIVVGAGARAIATKLSDGSVEMVLIEDVNAGVGVDLDAAAGSVDASVGGLAAFQQRFRFTNEAEADAAIRTLIEAARHDASFGELVADGGRWMFNRWADQVNVPADLANAVLDLALGVEPVPTVPTFDLTPELARALGRLWETNAVSRTAAAGVEAVAGIDAELELAAFDAELDATASAGLSYYETIDETTGAAAGRTEAGRSGVMLSGSVRADAETGAPSPGGSHTGFDGTFVLDLHGSGRGAELTVSLVGTIGAGVMAELFDLPVAELDGRRESTLSTSVEVTVPVDRTTRSDIGEISRLLARGVLPIAALARQYDRAHLSVEVARGRRTTAADVDVDTGVVEVDAEVAADRRTTRVAWRKYPNGRLFSPIEIDDLIEGAR